MNSKIKWIGNWKVSKLPQLIGRLQEIKESQLFDTRRALHGRGNYELAIQAKHLFVPHEAWVGMNEEQRKKWTLKFFKFHPQSTLLRQMVSSLFPQHQELPKKPGPSKKSQECKDNSLPNKKPMLG